MIHFLSSTFQILQNSHIKQDYLIHAPVVLPPPPPPPPPPPGKSNVDFPRFGEKNLRFSLLRFKIFTSHRNCILPPKL